MICRMSSVSKIFFLKLVACLFLQISFANVDSFSKQLVKAAQERTTHKVKYEETYRALGVDLQQLAHADTHASFSKYPNIWGLYSTDENIDHRRVSNLQTFFKRNGKELKVS